MIYLLSCLAGLFLLVSGLARAAEFTSPLSPQLLTSGAQRAFPTAEGFGASSTGGRGGFVYHVTNLNDSGAGSLRFGLTNQTGARTIVFDVSGIIDLTSNIVVNQAMKGDVTIAGQTAPGDGICIRGGTIDWKTDQLIIRHMCFRRGDQPGANRAIADGFSITHGTNVIADHLSLSWSLDELFQHYFGDSENNTLQYSLMYEPLDGNMGSGRHGFGPLVGRDGQNFSFHHNVIAHVVRRAPRVTDVQDIDVVNNIVYNWKRNATHIDNRLDREDLARINVINNVYRRGANDTGTEPLRLDGADVPDNASVFFGTGNEYYDGIAVTVPVDPAVVGTKNARDADVDVVVETAAMVWATLLDKVGARVPVLDPIDALVIQQIRDGTGRIVRCVDIEDQENSLLTETCTIESAYGSFYAYPETSRPAGYDTDGDGMPDAWETAHGLDPNDPADRNDDMVGDGWTNLETYLNQLAGDYSAAASLTVPTGCAPHDRVLFDTTADTPIGTIHLSIDLDAHGCD